MKRQIYLVILRLHFSLSFQSFENKWLNDFPFFISAFALFYLSLLSLGIEEFEKSIRRLAKWLGNLDQRSGQCSKVNSTVHPSVVDQMSTRNSWGVSGKKMSKHWLYGGMRESLQYHKSWLICHCFLNRFSRKCWVCSFHVVFGHISQNVTTLPSQSKPNGKSWTWNSSWYHGLITEIFGEKGNGGYHKILEGIIMLFLFGNKC